MAISFPEILNQHDQSDREFRAECSVRLNRNMISVYIYRQLCKEKRGKTNDVYHTRVLDHSWRFLYQITDCVFKAIDNREPAARSSRSIGRHCLTNRTTDRVLIVWRTLFTRPTMAEARRTPVVTEILRLKNLPYWHVSITNGLGVCSVFVFLNVSFIKVALTSTSPRVSIYNYRYSSSF